jgi:hypothetical protein
MKRGNVGPVIYETNPDGDKMDPECIPICDAINALDGLETVASCCGHGYTRFRIYFEAERIDDLKPILVLIDEKRRWRIRVDMATSNMKVYFILETFKIDNASDFALELAREIRAGLPGEKGQKP